MLYLKKEIVVSLLNADLLAVG